METFSCPPFVVQPASHPVLAKNWDSRFVPERKHLTDALVANVIPYREEIIRLVKQRGGGGVVVQNRDIIKWHRWLSGQGIVTSLEGALTLAGAERARQLNLISPKAKVICLLTGYFYGNGA